MHAFLHDDLATHLLVELKVRVNDEDNVKEFDNDERRKIMLILMAARGSKHTSRIHYVCALNECLKE